MRLDIGRVSHRLLTLFIVTDLAFIFLHVLNTYFSAVPNPLLSIEDDRGYGELYQHLKEFWIVGGLVLVATRRVRLLHVTWALLFLYFLLDDSLQIHEYGGYYIAEWLGFGPGFGLRAQDFGELTVYFLSGITLFTLIAATHFRSSSSGRGASMRLFIMVAVLLFFGVAVDMLHVIAGETALTPLLGTVEDGGEMLVMSVIAWFVLFSMPPAREKS